MPSNYVSHVPPGKMDAAIEVQINPARVAEFYKDLPRVQGMSTGNATFRDRLPEIEEVVLPRYLFVTLEPTDEWAFNLGIARKFLRPIQEDDVFEFEQGDFVMRCQVTGIGLRDSARRDVVYDVNFVVLGTELRR